MASLSGLNVAFGIKIVESVHAVQEDGTKDREIQIPRTWFERFFDPDPTHTLFQKTKTKIVQVPNYKPCAYLVKDQMLVIHPALMPRIREELSKYYSQ